MRKMKLLMVQLALVMGVVGTPLVLVPVAGAVNVFNKACTPTSTDAICKDVDSADAKVMVANITNLLLFVLGAVAVIVIIVGGIKYAASDGDAAKIKSAKNTILYAVVGIAVAIMAGAIVNFVVNNIK